MRIGGAVNPDDGTIDPSLLKTLAKEHQACFGVYARVVKTGTIRIGDKAGPVATV
jgi:hypothetical protein